MGIWQKHEAPGRAWPFGAVEDKAKTGLACHDGVVAPGARLLAGFIGILPAAGGGTKRLVEFFIDEAAALLSRV